MTNVAEDIKILLDNIADEFEKLFWGNFTSLYFHGAIAMDCFNPPKL